MREHSSEYLSINRNQNNIGITNKYIIVVNTTRKEDNTHISISHSFLDIWVVGGFAPHSFLE